MSLIRQNSTCKKTKKKVRSNKCKIKYTEAEANYSEYTIKAKRKKAWYLYEGSFCAFQVFFRNYI